MSPKKWQLLACALLSLASLAAFADLRTHQFTNFDDPDYVSENLQVQEGLTLQGVAWAFTSTHASNWHPLTWLSHMLDCQLFGLHPGAHLLINLFFHIANTLLLFLLLCRITRDRWPSLLVAALFALHPLHVQSVAWVAERKDVLSAFFFMLTLQAYAWYVAGPGLGRYSLVILCFILGLMAKPMVVTLPFVLLLLDYWPLKRWSLPGSSGTNLPVAYWTPEKTARVSLKRLLLEKVPLLALSAVSSLITLHAQREAITNSVLQNSPFAVRLGTALTAYLGYLGKTLWPSHLGVLYPHEYAIPWWRTVAAALILILLSVIIMLQARRRPYLPVGWLWFLGTLVPVIGLVHVGNQAMADRYTYLPLIGLFIMAAWGLAELAARRRIPGYLWGLAAGGVMAALMTCTWLQVRHWRDSISLFTHTLKVTRNNPIAHTSLGVALAAEGRLLEAVSHYEEALRLEPSFYLAHNNLGAALAALDQAERAAAHFEEALRLYPDYLEAHNNLGNTFFHLGRLQEAALHYREVARLRPGLLETHYRLGFIFLELGEMDQALVHYQEAVNLGPDFALTLDGLARVLATAADPGLRDGARAVQLAEEANRLTGNSVPPLLDTLAAAYAAAGRVPEALETARKARGLARAAGDQQLAKALEARIRLYQGLKGEEGKRLKGEKEKKMKMKRD
jgi:tetratricopeptide (TPR) repeat protein